MPTYEYECQKCSFTFELLQGINDKPRSRCPLCRGKVQRLIGTGVGIVFKGSGFYVTDSRARKASGGAKHKKSGAGDSSQSDTAKAGSHDKKSGGADTSAGKGASGNSTAKKSEKNSA